MHFDTTILEFYKIQEQITRMASTIKGKELTKEISPSNNHLEIKRLLGETDHAYQIITLYKEPPFGGIRDLQDTLAKARIQSVLRPTEFLSVIGLLEATSNHVVFYRNVKETEIKGDALDFYYDQLTTIKGLKQQIEQVISNDGEIHDSASHDLSRIRAKISQKQNKITEKLNTVLQKDASKLTEHFITIRNNRMVVPVKVSEKNNFKGAIIDYSSSGETVYMEPESVALLNNEISILKMDEEREIERILRELTLLIGSHHEELLNNFNMLTYLDMTFAKAKHAVMFECSMPHITENEINLMKARHPLINQHDVVANTITFNKDERIIIITGPNTGGKTVALKTFGLLSIMVQAGLMIPVDEESKTVIFENVFADIGDEQSIEQSLSTFSSHLSRIIHIVNNLSHGSLVLLDELGSGTDPKEGSALAISILDYIRVRGVYVIATTHYPELKAYAYDKDEIINASVEFNVETLSPTYRLLLGTPGKSNALLISERLGLNEKIINAAKSHVLTSQTEVTDLINKLEKQGNTLDQKIIEYQTLIHTNKELISETEQLKKELTLQKNELNRKAALSKNQIVKDTKEEALLLLKEIEDMRNNQEIKEHEIAELKYKVRNFNQDENRTSLTTNYQYQPGDLVTVLQFNRIGELVKKQKNNQWVVKMGTLSSTYKESEFEFVEHKTTKEEPKKQFKSSIKKTTKAELDLRGMHYEEAEVALEKYIDDCIVSKMPYASIIHGYGTLTLRKLVKTYLDGHPLVVKHRDGEGGEGGTGVTIAYFK